MIKHAPMSQKAAYYHSYLSCFGHVHTNCACRKFFIQPIFRDDGFFMLLSQFQTPSHFLLAYLEDFKMDPNRAQPLMTFSVFNDLAESHQVSLVRCDVINKGIEESEGVKVMQNMLDAYRLDEDFTRVEEFNEKPNTFDVDDFISSMNQKWKDDGSL